MTSVLTLLTVTIPGYMEVFGPILVANEIRYNLSDLQLTYGLVVH